MVSLEHQENIPRSKTTWSRELFCPTRNHTEHLRWATYPALPQLGDVWADLVRLCYP